MTFYVLRPNPDIPIQTILDLFPDVLRKKNLYEPYQGGEIDCIRLDEGAILTDLLSIGTISLHGLVINEKLYHLFQEFNLHEVQFTNIIDEQLPGYKFMFFNGDLTHELDYEKSGFRVIRRKPLSTTVLDIDVPSNREGAIAVYMEDVLESIFNFLEPQAGYVFKPSFDVSKYDALRIGHFDDNFYISERLKDKMVEEGITGVDYIKQDLFG